MASAGRSTAHEQFRLARGAAPTKISDFLSVTTGSSAADFRLAASADDCVIQASWSVARVTSWPDAAVSLPG